MNTDQKPNTVTQVANALKNKGILIVGCKMCGNTYELPETFRTTHKKSVAYLCTPCAFKSDK